MPRTVDRPRYDERNPGTRDTDGDTALTGPLPRLGGPGSASEFDTEGDISVGAGWSCRDST
ncbi:MAG: hypothetical protein J07HX64_02707 [halophilic archaeon J07HX64]|jgi:hypothetical protein|nr:MAG: hypothetical protein J07HX64_02707 [halophilic archaeon J07HX64]